MGERVNGIHEVRGSIPLASTPRQDRAAVRAWTGLREGGHSARPPSLVVAGIAQLVEHNLAKVGVAGSSPVSRSSSLDTSFLHNSVQPATPGG